MIRIYNIDMLLALMLKQYVLYCSIPQSSVLAIKQLRVLVINKYTGDYIGTLHTSHI